MMNDTTLIEFPCDFPVKIIGTNSSVFLNDVKAITLKHFPNTNDQAIKVQLSKNNNFLSITATVHVQNQAELDDYYRELTQHPDIKMVL